MNPNTVLLIFLLLRCCLAADLACNRPNNSEVAAEIFKRQTSEIEGSRLVVVSVYYNCIQWNASLTHVERLVVSVTLDPAIERQRWVLDCQSDGSLLATQLGSVIWSTTNESVFNCGVCLPSPTAQPCQGT